MEPYELFTLLVQKEGLFGGESRGNVLMSVRAASLEEALEKMSQLSQE